MLITPPDIAISIILFFFAFNGFRHGFIEEIGKIISLISGFVCASKFHHLLMPYMVNYIETETLQVTLPAILSTDLRLNEPRYASLPNIMKAKKKPIVEKSPEEYGVDINPRLEMPKITEPPKRSAGIIVPDSSTLVEKLRDETGVI